MDALWLEVPESGIIGAIWQCGSERNDSKIKGVPSSFTWATTGKLKDRLPVPLEAVKVW